MKTKPNKNYIYNPFTSNLDIITDNNFSYESIEEDDCLLIPENNQMIIMDRIIIDGELRLDGSLVVED